MGEHAYVLGGGIAGLLTGYFKRAEVLTDSLGQPPLGPRYLHYSTRAERLLEALDIFSTLREVKCAALSDQGLVTSRDDEVRSLYATKLGLDPKKDKLPADSMSEGKWRFLVYSVPIAMLQAVVQAKVKIRFCKVLSIDPDRCIIDTDRGRIEYAELYSTIPLPSLISLCGDFYNLSDFQYLPVGYDLVMDSALSKISGFDYLYDLRTTTPYYRLTPVDQVLAISEQTKSLKNAKVVVKYGKILNTLAWKEYRGIKLVGRYARWIPKYYIDDVVRDLGIE